MRARRQVRRQIGGAFHQYHVEREEVAGLGDGHGNDPGRRIGAHGDVGGEVEGEGQDLADDVHGLVGPAAVPLDRFEDVAPALGDQGGLGHVHERMRSCCDGLGVELDEVTLQGMPHIHDLIEPQIPQEQTELVYPVLIELIEQP